MKKIVLTLCALCVLTSASIAAETDNKVPEKKNPPTREQMMKMHHAREAVFEQKLGLTEVQKLKVREQRKQGFEKIKPVMEQLKAKKQEAEMIRRSKLTVEEQEAKLAVLDKEIQELQKQANVIRKQNMKDFESILTSKQRKTLKQMKKEGRNKFEQGRKLTPPPCPSQKPKEIK